MLHFSCNLGKYGCSGSEVEELGHLENTDGRFIEDYVGWQPTKKVHRRSQRVLDFGYRLHSTNDAL